MAEYTGTDNLEIMAEAVNYNRFLERLVVSHAGPAGSVLDFGAGIGTFATAIKDKGLNVSCLEVDPEQAKCIEELGLDVSGDIDQLADDSFDYVYSLNVLEHIEHHEEAMRQLYRIIKPGGRLLVYVPAMQILYSSMDKKVGHFRRYTRKSLSGLARQGGFSVQECRYADSLGFPATLLYKLLDKLQDNNSGDLSKTPLILYDRIAFPVSRLLDILFAYFLGKNVYAVLQKEEYS